MHPSINSLRSSDSHELTAILLPQPRKCCSYSYVHHPRVQWLLERHIMLQLQNLGGQFSWRVRVSHAWNPGTTQSAWHGMVVQACNPSAHEVETGGPEAHGHLDYRESLTSAWDVWGLLSKNKTEQNRSPTIIEFPCSCSHQEQELFLYMVGCVSAHLWS